LIRWIMVGASMIVLAAVVLASLAERNNAETKSPLASGGRPVIKIEHFKDTGQGNISDNVLRRLTDEIVVDLSKFTELVLIAPDDAPQKVDPTYVLQGSVRLQDGHMRPVARLVRKADGVVVWSADYDVSTEGRSTLDVVAAIGRSIARAIAAPLSEPVVGATGGAASTLRPASYFQPAEGVSTETSRPISAMGDQAQQLRIPQRQGGSASSPLWAMTTV
jgi:TolB-like protein